MDDYISELITEAEKGNIDAQGQLGACYIRGLGVEPNPDEGVKWLTLSAQAGDAVSCYNLANVYLNEENFIDYSQAFKWALKAAKLDDPDSQALLAKFFYSGLGCIKSIEDSIEWGEKSIAGGDKSSLILLGDIYLELYLKNKSNKQYAEIAFNYHQQAFDSGIEEASSVLAWFYWHDLVVEKDLRKAYDLYLSGNSLNSATLFDLGLMLQESKATFFSEEEKYKYYMLVRQLEVDSDWEKISLEKLDESELSYYPAFYFQYKAFVMGRKTAKICLSELVAKKLVSYDNHSDIFQWHICAAEQGFAFAFYELANYYREGLYIRQDLKKACDYYIKAISSLKTTNPYLPFFAQVRLFLSHPALLFQKPISLLRLCLWSFGLVVLPLMVAIFIFGSVIVGKIPVHNNFLPLISVIVVTIIAYSRKEN